MRVERDAQEAIRLSRSIDQPAAESFASWELGLWYGFRGLAASRLAAYATAFELAQHGLRVAEEIDHRQWVAGALSTLGVLYLDVLAPDRARPLLERALSLAHELGSSLWTPYATARLAQAATLAGPAG
jgi:hypothetical protein